MERGPKRGHYSRSRSLQTFNTRFSEPSLETYIKSLLKFKKNIRLATFVRNLRKKGYNIKYRIKDYVSGGNNRFASYLIIQKNSNKKLKLNLKFDKLSSFNLNQVSEKHSDIFWATEVYLEYK